MKVTKAKGPTRCGWTASARGFGRRRPVLLAALRVRHEEQNALALRPDARWCEFALSVANRNFDAKRAGQIVFRPFALVTSLGQQMKVTGQPGPDPARYWRDKTITSVRTTRT
jgi:hypothetical protein